MNKNILKYGIILALVPIIFAGCGENKELSPSDANSAKGEAVSEVTEAFTDIRVSAASGTITLSEGEEFSLSYHLSEKEIVKEAYVKDGTLIFSTGADRRFKPDFGDFYVDITIPEGHSLSEIDLSSVAGDVVLKVSDFEDAELFTVSGSIKAENTSGKKLEAETTSGNIEFTNVKSVEAEAQTVSGKITSEGNFGKFEGETISGSIASKGEITNEAKLETVSGNISFNGNVSSVEAVTAGKITYMGNTQGKKLNISQGEPYLYAKSISGAIAIN